MPIVAILGALAQFAPMVAKYFGKGENVATAVANIAQQVTGSATPEEALAKLQADAALQLKFKEEVMANETHLEEVYLQDTQNARLRDIELAKAGQSNKRANILAALAILLVALCLVDAVWDSQLNEYAKGIVTLVLGRALGWVEQIFSFEFGTTRASKTKDDTINKLSSGS